MRYKYREKPAFVLQALETEQKVQAIIMGVGG
jgi:hypothetical protein